MTLSKMKILKTIELDVPDLPFRIRSTRIADGRSISELCRQIGMSRTNWYRMEAGTQSLPLETLRKLQHVFGNNLGIDIE
jgi:transcriptional regulator with XRE-family HTH domain